MVVASAAVAVAVTDRLLLLLLLLLLFLYRFGRIVHHIYFVLCKKVSVAMVDWMGNLLPWQFDPLLRRDVCIAVALCCVRNG